MSVWTVKPEDVKIDLKYISQDGSTNPFWIKVKRYLTVGEQRRVLTAGWRGMSRGGETGTEIQINWQAQTFARTETYLVDWSLTDDKDAKLPVTREVIEALSGDVYALIENAITAHVEAIEQEKKVTAGTPSPSAT